MKTFKAYIFKEHIESLKQTRYLILAAGIILFALLDPIMLKLLPTIISSQSNMEMPVSIVSADFALHNYIKDLHQIGFIFVIFSFAGTLSSEMKSQKLVIPFSKGAMPYEIVLAKIVHYFTTVLTLSIIGLMINYAYVAFSIGIPELPLWKLIYPIISINIYYWFFLAVALFFSSFFKKTSSIGILVLLLSYLFGIVGGFSEKWSNYLPGNIINIAYSNSFDGTYLSIIIVFISIITLVYLSILRLNRVELN